MKPKRTSLQIQKERSEAVRLHLRGKTQIEIAESLGLSQPQISYDLKAVIREWQRERLADLDMVKAEQLAKLDYYRAPSMGSMGFIANRETRD